MQPDRTVPNASTLTSAPLRHRWQVELSGSLPEVWTLVGDLARMPEYSDGLERVDVKTSSSGAPSEYICHFRPMEPGGPGAVSRERIRWYAPNRGWASVGEEPNDFGQTGSLHLVTLTPAGQRSLLTWEAYYEATDLETSRTALDAALADIAHRLIARFGGRVVDRWVDGLRQ